MNPIKTTGQFIKRAWDPKSLVVLSLRAAGVLLFFFVTLFITNNFSADIVGMYDFSRSLLFFLGIVAVFGMQQSIIYYSGYLAASNNRSYIKKIYSKMVLLVFCLSVVVLLGSIIYDLDLIQSFLNLPINETAARTITVVFFYGLTLLNIDAFRAIDRIYVSEMYRNLVRYALFAAGVLFIFYTGRPELLVSVFLYNFVALSIISSGHLLYYFYKDKTKSDCEGISIGSIIKRSAPMAVSGASFLLMQSVDVLMLTHFTNYETVAYYSVAVKLTLLISIVLASINAVIAPQIAELFASNQWELLKSTIARATQLIFFVTTPIILVLMIFTVWVLGFFGTEYTIARTSLWILLIGQIINAACGSVGVYLNMTGKQTVFQVILVSALVLNIVLNFILIPKHGMIGAAIASSVSMVLWNISAVAYAYRKDKIKIFLTFK